MSEAKAPRRLPFRERARHHRPALAGAMGLFAALGQVPFGFAPATVLALAGAVMLLDRAAGPRAAALVGWSFGAGYFAATLHWLVEPFLIDLARHGWMAPFALVLMAAGLALFWGGAFALAAGVGAGVRRAVALVVALTAAEWLRATVLGGFPWAMIGYAWTETPAIHAAALVGPYGLTFLTVLAAAGLAAAAGRRNRLLWAGAALAPLALVAGSGAWLAARPLPDGGAEPIVRLVQPNAPQREKWDPDRARTFFERQVEFTRAGEPPDLVVWPETAIPWLLDGAEVPLQQAAAAARGATLILGALRVEGGRTYNSLAVLTPEAEIADIYDKHHLVPFGEFIPLGGLARLIGLRSLAARDGYGFSAGPGPRLIDLGALGRPLPLICYEAIFPRDVSGAPERPDWLLQITNDAWFGTFSGPYQHLAQARMRAVEQGLPMVRVANTGVSAVIDARGRILRSLALGKAGYLDVALPPAAPPTLYSRTGDLPLLVVLLVAAATLALARKSR